MKWIFILLLSSMLFYGDNAHSEPLTKARIKSFSEKLLVDFQKSPKNIYKYLSEDLQVEISIGSNVQGLTLFFNKSQYSLARCYCAT